MLVQIIMEKTLLSLITVLILFGCESQKNCQKCDTKNWISTANKSSKDMIIQLHLVLLEQENEDSSFINSEDINPNKFLTARNTLRKKYQNKTLKWFKKHPQSWISIKSNSVTVNIQYCEKWCEGIPYTSQLYFVQTKSDPKLLWKGASSVIAELVHIEDDWYLLKTECEGCGI